ncbi:NAD-dependent succinate-semialdehyde dehydrogenase [Thermoflexibacter ruber]|uniref:Succinate-semialdehyde dehydrogenase / glutarate-semialdehyde dehydrogenase n=1 Tax=Thermoflexibacter ruber TaxID=1003 RepID=A0A1I2F2K9_9BACT|nr:NAD-dependent succinate-semialdehyde dehydrogenase [Thermoflexibacter ruber]SFE98948.1 succinate-semialdehyde dehydrogenase / glutarate-semialdehyde dehydrogenase [Thermoflexibacter ruber]
MKFKTINPYNNRPIEDFDTYTDEKIADMLYISSQAFISWKSKSYSDRAELFFKLSDILRTRQQAFADTISKEMGKPIKEAKAEIMKCAWVCDYYAQHAAKFMAEEEVKTDASKSYIVYEPLGIVLGIMPWNFPFWQVFRFAAPALMAGNTVVLKPATSTIRAGLVIEYIFLTAGFPRGTFQTIIADNEQIRQMIGSPYIQGVALTGSERAGIAVASAAGANIKKTVLELGGSDPFIVFADADLKEAAKIGVQSRMINGGQSCVAAKRFLVEESILDKFVEFAKQEMEKLVVGDPLDEKTDVGPMARLDLAEKLHEQVQKSIKKGAKLVMGGEQRGSFYMPTILTEAKYGMPIFDEETFGPIMAISSFKTEEEAIRLANSTDFGLAATVFTQNIQRAERMSRALEVGSVYVNALAKSDPRMPFGGTKKSGYGRELYIHGIREFTNVKTVYIA